MNKSILKIISLLVFLMSGLTAQAQLKSHGNFQYDFYAKMPYGLNTGYEHWYGAEALYQYKMKNSHITANGGLLFDIGRADISNANWNYRKFVMVEVGIPLMMEFLTGTNSSKNGGFLGIGVIPTFYANVKSEETMEGTAEYRIEGEKEKGLYIAPKFELGVYAPFFGSNTVRISAFGAYDINFSRDSKGRDIFYHFIARAMYGVSLGVMF